MSTSDNIFIHTGLSIAEAAEAIRAALGIEAAVGEGEKTFLVRELDSGPVRRVGGELAANLHLNRNAALDEVSVIDGYEYNWDVRSVPSDRALLHGASRALFRELASALSWRMILVQQLDLLMAGSSPETGLVEFEPAVSPDADAVGVWRAFDVNR